MEEAYSSRVEDLVGNANGMYVCVSCVSSIIVNGCEQDFFSLAQYFSWQHLLDKFHVAWVPMFMQITSWIMFAVGCCYMLLGICCLWRLRDKLRDSFQERLEEYNSTTVIATSE
jgi:hypothetical protein